MIVSVSSAKANINGDSTVTAQTAVNYFQAETNENTVTLTWEITGTDKTLKVGINIMNLAGEMVYQAKTNGYSSTVTLDDSIKPGIYMAQISAGNIQRTKRLVIR